MTISLFPLGDNSPSSYNFLKLQSYINERENAGLRRFAEETSEVSTTSTSFTDLGGPSITIGVPPNAFVAIFIEVDMHASAGAVADAGIVEATDMASGVRLAETTSATYVTMFGTTDGVGTTDSVGAWLVRPASTGTRTYSLVYREAGGTATFRNRRLWVQVV